MAKKRKPKAYDPIEIGERISGQIAEDLVATERYLHYVVVLYRPDDADEYSPVVHVISDNPPAAGSIITEAMMMLESRAGRETEEERTSDEDDD